MDEERGGVAPQRAALLQVRKWKRDLCDELVVRSCEAGCVVSRRRLAAPYAVKTRRCSRALGVVVSEEQTKGQERGPPGRDEVASLVHWHLVSYSRT